MPDTENQEGLGVLTLPTVARPLYNPFGETDDLKFIRFSGQALAEVARNQGKTLPEDVEGVDVIFLGPDSLDHWQIVSENLGLDRDAISGLRFSDAGHIYKIDDKEAILLGSSGEIIAEDGIEFFRMQRDDPNKLEELHKETVRLLAEIYKDGENQCVFKLMERKTR